MILRSDPYAHEGCTGRFEGYPEHRCTVCDAEPEGLQAWLPDELAPKPQWYLDIRKSLDVIAPLVDEVIARARKLDGGP